MGFYQRYKGSAEYYGTLLPMIYQVQAARKCICEKGTSNTAQGWVKKIINYDGVYSR